MSDQPTDELFMQRALELARRAASHEEVPVGAVLGRDGWRIRSQNYRVIYDIDDATKRVLIQVIGHRRDVYRH
jgi:mRNA interferase RelE/StbE